MSWTIRSTSLRPNSGIQIRLIDDQLHVHIDRQHQSVVYVWATSFFHKPNCNDQILNINPPRLEGGRVLDLTPAPMTKCALTSEDASDPEWHRSICRFRHEAEPYVVSTQPNNHFRLAGPPAGNLLVDVYPGSVQKFLDFVHFGDQFVEIITDNDTRHTINIQYDYAYRWAFYIEHAAHEHAFANIMRKWNFSWFYDTVAKVHWVEVPPSYPRIWFMWGHMQLYDNPHLSHFFDTYHTHRLQWIYVLLFEDAADLISLLEEMIYDMLEADIRVTPDTPPLPERAKLASVFCLPTFRVKDPYTFQCLGEEWMIAQPRVVTPETSATIVNQCLNYPFPEFPLTELAPMLRKPVHRQIFAMATMAVDDLAADTMQTVATMSKSLHAVSECMEKATPGASLAWRINRLPTTTVYELLSYLYCLPAYGPWMDSLWKRTAETPMQLSSSFHALGHIHTFYQWVSGGTVPHLPYRFSPEQRMMLYVQDPTPEHKEALESMDLTGVTDLSKLYVAYARREHAASAPPLDVSRWNVSSVTDMQNLFADLQFDVCGFEHWDVRKVRNMDCIFACSPGIKLRETQFKHWNCAALATAQYAAVGHADTIRLYFLNNVKY